MSSPIDQLTMHIIDGVLGGLLYIIISKLGYNDRWDITRRLLLGLIAGYIAYLSKIPDLATVGIGYIGIDAIEAILIKNDLIKPTLRRPIPTIRKKK